MLVDGTSVHHFHQFVRIGRAVYDCMKHLLIAFALYLTHGNKYLRQILIEIAWVASRTRNCFFFNFSYIQTTVKKKSKMKIQVAIARKILGGIS